MEDTGVGYRDTWVYRHQAGLGVGLMGLIVIGIVATIAACVVMSTTGDHQVPDAVVAWGCGLSFGVPVLLAAMLGASTMHRHGWVVGVGFGVGFVLLAVSIGNGSHALRGWGIVAILLGGFGFFVLGFLRGIALPFGANRWMARGRDAARDGIDEVVGE